MRAIAAAGVRKAGEATPATILDRVHLGSNTKATTSTVLATLVADATFRQGWDTTIADVFPELRDAIDAAYAAPVGDDERGLAGDPPAMGPAGNVHLTLEDWATFAGLWLGEAPGLLRGAA